MTRTFVAGGEAPPAELQEYWELTRASLEAVKAAIRPARSAATCTGSPASRSRRRASRRCARRSRARCWPRATTTASGTGSGLEVHERPNLGRSDEKLIAGDVVTVEPGCYRQGFGGVRLEDLLLVTEDGCEVLTDFPYDLSP